MVFYLPRKATLAVCALLISGYAMAQASLPFPDPPSPSTARRTMQESTYKRQKPVQHLRKDAPNILIIMLDDVGPGLPSTYGGLINTPTLTRVANSGISYNRFHNAAMCSPTRAALLTGRNHHRVGNGQITELSNNWDGYTGVIPTSSATVAKVLGAYGYKTSAFGKWHNTPATDTGPMGPFAKWPTGERTGFDYFYGFLAGESSQWEPKIVENTNQLPMPHKPKYHFTEDMTDKAIAWLRQRKAATPDAPFMMYWAPGAAHGPHHIFKEWADKYKGKFDEGWDKMRERQFAQQKANGWIPANTVLTPRPSSMASWESIPAAEKPFQLRLMETFAGFVEHTDTQAGRVIDELESQGILDNTLVFYILSDNGSSAEGQNGTISELLAQNSITTKVEDHIRALNELGGLDVIGSAKTDNMYHAGWAWAGSTPFQATKLVASHFGGTRTPMAVSWPRTIKSDKTPRSQFHHVNDIVPTIYDIVGIEAPKTVDGVAQEPIDGVSLQYSFATATAPGRKKSQYFEIMGSRAIYMDEWIASTFGPRTPWLPGLPPGIKEWNPDQDTWELYDLRKDFSQGKDLAKNEPKRLEDMKKTFDKVAKDNKVYPIGGGLWSIAMHPEDAPKNPATVFNYTGETVAVPEFIAPKVGSVSNLVTIEAELLPDAKGVLYALGAFSGGLALWVENGALTYEYNLFEIERTQIASKGKLPTGLVKIEIETQRGKGHVAPLDVVIRVNGAEVAKGRVPRAAPLMFTANDTFDVGMDNFSPVSLAYFDRAPFKYSGKINTLDVRYLETTPATH